MRSLALRGRFGVAQGYEFSELIKMEIEVGDKTTRRTFATRDQLVPEIIYFLDCILDDRNRSLLVIKGLRMSILSDLYNQP
jgi:hypothetical protein